MAALLTAAMTSRWALSPWRPISAGRAHGAAMTPGSRTYLCWQDGRSQTGEIRPNNPACSAAVAQSGANSLYNWFSVLRSDAGGRTTGFIPDGNCAAAATPATAATTCPAPTGR
ncbi:lytic polysaccharide monooxygenase [Micromonospora sp. M12]